MLYSTRTIRLVAIAMAFVATPAGLLVGQTITFPAGDFPGGQTSRFREHSGDWRDEMVGQRPWIAQRGRLRRQP